LALDKNDVIQVKEAFKWIMQSLVGKELGGISVVTKVGNIHYENESTSEFEECFGVCFSTVEVSMSCSGTHWKRKS